MKRIIFGVLACVFIFSGCYYCEKEGDTRTVAQINQYKMTADDLKYDIATIPYDRLDLLSSKEGRKEYINGLIDREVLLQEAQKKGIDKEKDFMRSIENYWEQTLIKRILERKSKEISAVTNVYDNEIEEYYNSSEEHLPLPKVKADIRKAIRMEKEAEALNAWVDELKKQASIKINTDLADEVIESIK